MAIRELNHLIPNFQKKINEGTPDELTEFYGKVGNIVLEISIFTY
jgi:hypothetical protein